MAEQGAGSYSIPSTTSESHSRDRPKKYDFFFIVSNKDITIEDRSRRTDDSLQVKFNKLRTRLEAMGKKVKGSDEPDDYLPSKDKIDSVRGRIAYSRVVVLVQTESATRSKWCQFQFQLAKTVQKRGDPRLLLLYSSDFSANQLDTTVKLLKEATKTQVSHSLTLRNEHYNFFRLHLLVDQVATPALEHLLNKRLAQSFHEDLGVNPFYNRVLSLYKRMRNSDFFKARATSAQKEILKEAYLNFGMKSQQLISFDVSFLMILLGTEQSEFRIQKSDLLKGKELDRVVTDQRCLDDARIIQTVRNEISHFDTMNKFNNNYFHTSWNSVTRASEKLLADDSRQLLTAKQTQGEIVTYGNENPNGLSDLVEELDQLRVQQERTDAQQSTTGAGTETLPDTVQDQASGFTTTPEEEDNIDVHKHV